MCLGDLEHLFHLKAGDKESLEFQPISQPLGVNLDYSTATVHLFEFSK